MTEPHNRHTHNPRPKGQQLHGCRHLISTTCMYDQFRVGLILIRLKAKRKTQRREMLKKKRRCITRSCILSVPVLSLATTAVTLMLIPSWSSWTNRYHHHHQNHGQVSALQVSMMAGRGSTFTTTPPLFGIGAVLFPVRGTTISVLGGDDNDDMNDIRQDIDDATDFFVDAFWTAKVGGGAQSLSERQRKQLVQSQQAEFMKRYGGRRKGGKKLSAFLIMRGGAKKKKKQESSSASAATTFTSMIQRPEDDRGEILACVGIEVDGISDGAVGRGRSPVQEYAPLMSNLAVSRKYRRRGLAEAMVKACEDYIRKTWPDEYNHSLYLYVERRNTRAIQLYQKLGYRRMWQDGDAQTLLPMDNGNLQSVPTVLVCMKKNLNSGNNPFARLFG
jgi:ribosomal protein S18 acetylase RimI-like enzyme